MRNSIFFVLVVASLESGCGAKLPSMKPFKMEIQQGNVVTSKMLLQLRPGMTRSQVRYIMGTPLVVDSFRDNRWDYFYELRKEGVIVEKRRVILDFDKDSLVSVRGDVIPSAENPDVKTIAEPPKQKLAEEKNDSWTDKLKFWKDDAADAAKAPAAAQADKAGLAAVPAETAAEAQASAAAEETPAIPEGEYKAKQAAAAQNASASAEVAADSEKEMAARVADTVEPPPVFEQEKAAAATAAASPAPAASAAPKASPAAKSVLAPAAAASLAASASSEKAAKPLAAKPAPAAPVVQAPVKAQESASAMDDDEVIPYIPEGEYEALYNPSEADMVKGNMEGANAPETDAQAHQVTQKGEAASGGNADADAPTFIAEQMPEPEPEPELPPPPPPKSVLREVVKPGTSAAALAAQPTETAARPKAEAPVATTEAPAGDETINQAVSGWAQAWRSKDINSYFAAYAPEFVPESAASRKAWELQRKQRLSPQQGAITLVLNNLQVQRNGNTATVQFQQKYAAKAYSDTLLKTLEMRYDAAQKRWLIVRERVAAAETDLPSTLPTAEVAKAPVTSSPAAEKPSAVEASVDAAVTAWAQAWRNKNVSAYFAAYAPEFVPEGLPDRGAWEAQRKKRLSPQQGKITLEIGQVEVARDGDIAFATFTQKYASKAYRDEMVKRLQLKLDTANNRWLIVRETAASGAPAAKQEVTAPEESADHLDGVLEQIGF